MQQKSPRGESFRLFVCVKGEFSRNAIDSQTVNLLTLYYPEKHKSTSILGKNNTILTTVLVW